jgi:hypothetical protein
MVLIGNLLVTGIMIPNSDFKSRINTIFNFKTAIPSYLVYGSEGIVQGDRDIGN